jgi:biotin carboxyl carrier protein
MNKQTVWPLLVAAVLGSCSKNESSSVEPARGPAVVERVQPPTSVPTPWVKLRPSGAAPLFEGPAQVLPSPGSAAEVMPAFTAQVVQVLVQPGQRVVAGEPLCVVLMPEVLRAAGSHVGAGLRLHAYAQRREQLLALKGEGLTRLSEQMEVEARIAETKASQLEALAVLHSAGLSPAEAASLSASGGRITLRSPIAGVVVDVHVNLGQVIQPGSQVMRVVGSSGQRIEARLSAQLPTGARFELILPGGKRRALRLLERSPQVDGRDGTILSWLVSEFVDGAKARPLDAGVALDPELVPGLVARIAVYSATAQTSTGTAWVVPTRALRLAESGAELLRRGPADVPQPLVVKVLWSSGVDSLVSADGLHEGDLVAADASFYHGPGGGEP